jgi:hypothetical protein
VTFRLSTNCSVVTRASVISAPGADFGKRRESSVPSCSGASIHSSFLLGQDGADRVSHSGRRHSLSESPPPGHRAIPGPADALDLGIYQEDRVSHPSLSSCSSARSVLRSADTQALPVSTAGL